MDSKIITIYIFQCRNLFKLKFVYFLIKLKQCLQKEIAVKKSKIDILTILEICL